MIKTGISIKTYVKNQENKKILLHTAARPTTITQRVRLEQG